MTTKRIVLIGGPSTGKTTLLNALKDSGQTCYAEISRTVTRAAQEEGIAQLFLTDPLLFSQKLLEYRIIQFKDAEKEKQPYVFIDRGIPDVVAYMDYMNQEYPAYFKEACQEYRYDQIFILPPWQEIHTTDGERYENFEQATAIQDNLIKTYTQYGYDLIKIPKASVEERLNFVMNHIQR